MGWYYSRKESGIIMTKIENFVAGLNYIPRKLLGFDILDIPEIENTFELLGIFVGLLIVISIMAWIIIKIIDKFDSTFSRKF
jgi:uncharacterized metal-binding protein